MTITSTNVGELRLDDLCTANQLTAQCLLENSIAGKIGRVIELVIKPLGLGWQIGIVICTGNLSLFAAQCLAISGVVRRETNSLKWPLFQAIYMTCLARLARFVTCHIYYPYPFGVKFIRA